MSCRPSSLFFFFNDTATTEIYTLSLHDALPIYETGHIVYRGGLGPFHYKPAEVRQWLAAKYGAVKQGAQTAAASASRASAPASTSSEGTTSLSVPAKSEK